MGPQQALLLLDCRYVLYLRFRCLLEWVFPFHHFLGQESLQLITDT
jgi:hypothetical protein